MRHLIPLLALPAVLPAFDLGGSGVTLSGYVETTGRIEQQQERNPHRQQRTSPGDTWIDASGDLALKLGWRADRFRAKADLFAYSRAPSADGQQVVLEQAFIDYEADEWLTVRTGRFQTTWIGWEGFHTPELWRVNHLSLIHI
jgi:hypothetical protein